MAFLLSILARVVLVSIIVVASGEVVVIFAKHLAGKINKYFVHIC